MKAGLNINNGSLKTKFINFDYNNSKNIQKFD